MKDPFDFWNKNAVLEYEKEDVRVYKMDDEHYLFIDQVIYASTTERPWYIQNVMPHAEGRCLEIGLGLGVASKVILAKPEVKHLLTVELNEAVIGAFGRPFTRHNILCADIYKWIDNFQDPTPMYDLIFVDHYTSMEDELWEDLKTLVEKLAKLLKEDGKLIIWIDQNMDPKEIAQFKELWIW